MDRVKQLVKLVVEGLGSSDPEAVSLAAFLAIYTRVDGGSLVLDPLDKHLRKSLDFAIRGGVPRSSLVESLARRVAGEGASPSVRDPVLEARVRDSIALVKGLGIDVVKKVVAELLEPLAREGASVESIVERILEVREGVDEFLSIASSTTIPLGVESVGSEAAEAG